MDISPRDVENAVSLWREMSVPTRREAIMRAQARIKDLPAWQAFTISEMAGTPLDELPFAAMVLVIQVMDASIPSPQSTSIH